MNIESLAKDFISFCKDERISVNERAIDKYCDWLYYEENVSDRKLDEIAGILIDLVAELNTSSSRRRSRSSSRGSYNRRPVRSRGSTYTSICTDTGHIGMSGLFSGGNYEEEEEVRQPIRRTLKRNRVERDEEPDETQIKYKTIRPNSTDTKMDITFKAIDNILDVFSVDSGGVYPMIYSENTTTAIDVDQNLVIGVLENNTILSSMKMLLDNSVYILLNEKYKEHITKKPNDAVKIMSVVNVDGSTAGDELILNAEYYANGNSVPLDGTGSIEAMLREVGVVSHIISNSILYKVTYEDGNIKLAVCINMNLL